ncbi:PilZ domain-containing protein [Bdellovibrio bacteriovorus]|uniref:PilZ domain-containing protein n=1 Tax=Bdellovibrio bacteriovorus TaxID=959 RepID=A0A1Z3N969_BDEBC|nr:PilZ domain-containing protein [Bdellovibrio bacteriovorus]
MKSLMPNERFKDLIYLSSSQHLPLYLQRLRGVRWYRSRSAAELKETLQSSKGDLHVIIRTENLSLRAVQAFLSWSHSQVKASFIFIAQHIENSVHQLILNRPDILVLRESERERIEQLVTRRLNGESLKSRKQDRMIVSSPVMLKKSVMAESSPTGAWVQFLREGHMVDFSQGGAQISLGQEPVQKKDFISLMYKNQHGVWVSVESQVRWVACSPEGEQIIGVQFLAVSA